MHYRNGREAKNGDIVVQLRNRYEDAGHRTDGISGSAVAVGKMRGGIVSAVGVLHSAKPGSDHCNGEIAPIHHASTGACICDCLHVDDVAEFLREKGLDNRPAGK
jgi:hypothetical protein